MIPLDIPAPGASARGLIDGPVGGIECLLTVPEGAVSGIAVTCHPHPLYGGEMGNKVVYTLDSVAQKLGMAAIRFNFRGVGASQGEHDQARGETEDCLTVISWLRAQFPGKKLLLMGFSFGSFVSLSAAERAKPAVLVSIAPPFGKYFPDASHPSHPECPWLIIHSRDDEVVSHEETSQVLAGYDPKPRLLSVDGAGHFFHGRLGEIRTQVRGFIQANWGN